jgi:hypothetical protein
VGERHITFAPLIPFPHDSELNPTASVAAVAKRIRSFSIQNALEVVLISAHLPRRAGNSYDRTSWLAPFPISPIRMTGSCSARPKLPQAFRRFAVSGRPIGPERGAGIESPFHRSLTSLCCQLKTPHGHFAKETVAPVVFRSCGALSFTRLLGRRQMLGMLLTRQQLPLTFDSPAVIRDGAIFLNDTMAWYENRDRIGGDCLGHFAGVTRA